MNTLPVGPPALGIELAADASVSDDGWLVRELSLPNDLDGPPGVLQGGFAATIPVEVARAADPHGAPLTQVETRLYAPTPLGRTIQTRVRATDLVAHYEVETWAGDTLLTRAVVELAGRELTSRAYDLVELATVPLPPAESGHPFTACWGCGSSPKHELGQRIFPRSVSQTTVSMPWVADELLAGDDLAADPLVIGAVLDCPTMFASMPYLTERGYLAGLLGGFHLRMLRDAPVYEPLRIVARMDQAEGRKIRARSGLVDEDGVTYATADAFMVAVKELPTVAA